MSVLIVTNTPDDWPAQIENVQVVAANDYLTDSKFSELRGVKVFNLCRSYKYQTIGYYVSLLAEARGHKPLPSVTSVQDLKTHAIVRLASSDLEKLIEKSLAPIKSDKFELSIYFGRNMAQRYDRLCTQLFNQFQTPLLRANFVRDKNGWQLRAINAISTNDVPDAHWDFVLEAAQQHFAGRGGSVKKRARARFDLAILHNPEDADKPSNDKALSKFIKAAEAQGIHAEMITRDDYGSIGEFDALFIRETTQVNHHTYRFSRRAAGEGLVVIDDPQSIVRCTNKVFLAEILSRHKVATPKTLVVQAETADQIAPQLGFPCVLKKPDSSFSHGVVKVKNEAELAEKLKEFFEHSDLIIAQEFLPTTFDWRIGIIDRQPIYACKYYMATGHWQIIQQKEGKTKYGKSETLPIELAPRKAVQVALKAANLIGDGLYGVDVKESNGHFSVIEVNDNPNLDAGYEDAILKDELYRRIMSVFLRRIEQRKAGLS
ncbi:RimK family protein [Blastopirellula marina]|uniref:RimK family alpha-L-glutamate ligase n=1 Tax=Blastopirellula marina TaxID=124 RepID=A0A2S8FFA1_9BACT|nr:RimK family protein [Blastopirellula marina]PQO30848.1 RimK family alpha-L-glutamate ligase [Blastopirellula marina]PTL42701.1 RimK family alpha-L-glutamate ligase [Blastopirellula marina]